MEISNFRIGCFSCVLEYLAFNIHLVNGFEVQGIVGLKVSFSLAHKIQQNDLNLGQRNESKNKKNVFLICLK